MHSLKTAIKLIEANLVEEQEKIELLAETADIIWSSYTYDANNLEYGEMIKTYYTQVREKCTQLAHALSQKMPNKPFLKRLLKEAKEDPLPEVRYAVQTKNATD